MDPILQRRIWPESTLQHLKPPVDPASITWRRLRRDAFWQQVPAWRDVDETTFLNFRWQEQNTITNVDRLADVVRDLVSADFLADSKIGLGKAPMVVRVSPYL